MAKIPSAQTLSSVAYLTEIGRKYLFGKDGQGNPIRFVEDNGGDTIDKFEPKEFALFDSDTNYTITNQLESGDVPDIAGTNDNSCLKTTSNIRRQNKIAYQGDIPQSFSTDIDYISTPSNAITLQVGSINDYRENRINQEL